MLTLEKILPHDSYRGSYKEITINFQILPHSPNGIKDKRANGEATQIIKKLREPQTKP